MIVYAYPAIMVFLTLYLQGILGKPPQTAGLLFIPLAATLTVVAVFAGPITKRFGALPSMATGMVLMAAGAVVFAALPVGGSLTRLIVGEVILGIGIMLAIPAAGAVKGIFAKGQTFDIPALVADRALGERYARGTVVCSRLCPVDYHRFHFPVAGTPGAPTLTNGPLYSVNPFALRRHVNYLWENKRQRVTVDAGPFGLVTMVAVGATNVGSIVETYAAGRPVAKGDEKGYFRFGGSFVATLFEPGRIQLEADLIEAGETATELYAKMGSPLGRLA